MHPPGRARCTTAPRGPTTCGRALAAAGSPGWTSPQARAAAGLPCAARGQTVAWAAQLGPLPQRPCSCPPRRASYLAGMHDFALEWTADPATGRPKLMRWLVDGQARAAGGEGVGSEQAAASQLPTRQRRPPARPPPFVPPPCLPASLPPSLPACLPASLPPPAQAYYERRLDASFNTGATSPYTLPGQPWDKRFHLILNLAVRRASFSSGAAGGRRRCGRARRPPAAGAALPLSCLWAACRAGWWRLLPRGRVWRLLHPSRLGRGGGHLDAPAPRDRAHQGLGAVTLPATPHRAS